MTVCTPGLPGQDNIAHWRPGQEKTRAAIGGWPSPGWLGRRLGSEVVEEDVGEDPKRRFHGSGNHFFVPGR